MANYAEIIQHYKQEGWLIVPSYYIVGGANSNRYCKICGWENDYNGECECQDCKYLYSKEHRANILIHGVAVRTMKFEDWQVFRAIAKQIVKNEKPYATVEEFAKECKDHLEEIEQERRQTQKTEQQKIDEILHSS